MEYDKEPDLAILDEIVGRIVAVASP